MAQPLITLDNVTVRLRDRWYLRNTNWEIKQGEHWAVSGPNGSGKTTLAQTLAGRIPVVRGTVHRHFMVSEGLEKSILSVSSEERSELNRQEGVLDQARHFSGKIFDETLGHELFRPFLQDGDSAAVKRMEAACSDLDIQEMLVRPLHSLSTGELSKLLVARAVVSPPVFLILDEPFDGLDPSSRKQMEGVLAGLMARKVHLLLITHRIDEIFPGLTHVLLMNNGAIAARGKKSEVLQDGKMHSLFQETASLEQSGIPLIGGEWRHDASSAASALIEMEQVRVHYGPVQVLDQISWTMHAGENWAITGPNGSGKSTLLNLISGDELQAYANSIRVFGKKRGSGESVWDIKQKIGTVSHSLFTRYQKNLSVFETVCSGFFDSIGLYRNCTPGQKATAREWIRLLGIEALLECPFQHLSQGQRALALITRAMVKSPLLLLLDEPCAGLDWSNRQRVLELIELIGSRTATHIIYVTHHQEELVPCITHQLQLESGRAASAGPVS